MLEIGAFPLDVMIFRAANGRQEFRYRRRVAAASAVFMPAPDLEVEPLGPRYLVPEMKRPGGTAASVKDFNRAESEVTNLTPSARAKTTYSAS